MFKHYVRLRPDSDVIIKIFSDGIEQPIEGDIVLCESDSRQARYDYLITDSANTQLIPSKKLVNDEMVDRTQEEIDADKPDVRTTTQVLADVRDSISSVEQGTRFKDASKDDPFMIPLLQAGNYVAGRESIQASTVLTADDKTQIDNILPEE